MVDSAYDAYSEHLYSDKTIEGLRRLLEWAGVEVDFRYRSNRGAAQEAVREVQEEHGIGYWFVKYRNWYCDDLREELYELHRRTHSSHDGVEDE